MSAGTTVSAAHPKNIPEAVVNEAKFDKGTSVVRLVHPKKFNVLNPMLPVHDNNAVSLCASVETPTKEKYSHNPEIVTVREAPVGAE
jgi:hypothetical protein